MLNRREFTKLSLMLSMRSFIGKRKNNGFTSQNFEHKIKEKE